MDVTVIKFIDFFLSMQSYFLNMFNRDKIYNSDTTLNVPNIYIYMYIYI